MTLPRNLEAILNGARVKNPCELLNGGEKPEWFRCSTSGYWEDDVGARVLLPNAGTLALYAIQGSLELLDAQPEPEAGDEMKRITPEQEDLLRPVGHALCELATVLANNFNVRLTAVTIEGGHAGLRRACFATPTGPVEVKDLDEARTQLAHARDETALYKGELEKTKRRVTELEALVHVPGVWACAKCKMTLVSNTLHVPSGSISANREPQACPNGCGPLWPKTERQAGNELCDRLEAATIELAQLKAQSTESTGPSPERETHARRTDSEVLPIRTPAGEATGAQQAVLRPGQHDGVDADAMPGADSGSEEAAREQGRGSASGARVSNGTPSAVPDTPAGRLLAALARGERIARFSWEAPLWMRVKNGVVLWDDGDEIREDMIGKYVAELLAHPERFRIVSEPKAEAESADPPKSARSPVEQKGYALIIERLAELERQMREHTHSYYRHDDHESSCLQDTGKTEGGHD